MVMLQVPRAADQTVARRIVRRNRKALEELPTRIRLKLIEDLEDEDEALGAALRYVMREESLLD